MAHDPLADLLPAAGPATTARPARRESIRPAAPAQTPIRSRPQATAAPTTGIRYLVARFGATVRIRAFDREEHPHTEGVDKATAWERAQRYARARPNAYALSRRPAASIWFTDIDGTIRQVAAPDDALQIPYKAENLAAAYKRGWDDGKAGNDKDAQTTDPAEKGAYGRGFKAAK